MPENVLDAETTQGLKVREGYDAIPGEACDETSGPQPELNPPVEVFVAGSRPLAVWITSDERVYLLNGWNATRGNAVMVRAFVARCFGRPIANARDLRRLIIDTRVIDCSGLAFMPEKDVALIQDFLADYHAYPSDPDEKKPKGATCLSSILNAWVNDISDPRSEWLAHAHLNAQQANTLLREAGYLNEENAPTPLGESMGFITETWHAGPGEDHPYAVYPPEHHPAIRSLIYELCQASSTYPMACAHEPKED